MNVVLDDAEEVYDCSAKPGKEPKPRRDLGMLFPKRHDAGIFEVGKEELLEINRG